MMDAQILSKRLADYLGSEVRASEHARRISVLTPVDYPDRDGVVVYVEAKVGGYSVSDMGLTDAMLAPLPERRILRPARAIASRFEVDFKDGQVIAEVADEDGLPDACWRVAQAAAAIAAAPEFLAPPRPQSERSEIAEALADALIERGVAVERGKQIPGISGHVYRTSIVLPDSHLVVEPVEARQPQHIFDRARRVASEFLDLRSVNGFKFLAVLDDSDDDLGGEELLLRSVAEVERWSAHEDWIPKLGDPSSS